MQKLKLILQSRYAENTKITNRTKDILMNRMHKIQGMNTDNREKKLLQR